MNQQEISKQKIPLNQTESISNSLIQKKQQQRSAQATDYEAINFNFRKKQHRYFTEDIMRQCQIYFQYTTKLLSSQKDRQPTLQVIQNQELKFTMINVHYKQSQEDYQFSKISNQGNQINQKSQYQLQSLEQFQQFCLQHLRKQNTIIDKDKQEQFRISQRNVLKFMDQRNLTTSKMKNYLRQTIRLLLLYKNRLNNLDKECQHPAQSRCAANINFLKDLFDKMQKNFQQYVPQDLQTIMKYAFTKDLHSMFEKPKQKKQAKNRCHKNKQ